MELRHSPNHPPLLIAHRGARREAPENTIPAFKRALELGADGIEFDVMLTSDRVPVVTHNDDLNILTDHKGFVRDTPLAVIRSLSANFQIPTLAETLEAIRGHDILVIAEIKAQAGLHSESARIIGDEINNFRGRFMVSSSCFRILYELKKRHPKIPRALIIKKRSFSFLRAYFFGRVAGVEAIHPSLGAATEDFIRRVRKMNLRVDAWTANTPRDFEKCLALGVDGIITDDIAGARGYLESSGSRGRAAG